MRHSFTRMFTVSSTSVVRNTPVSSPIEDISLTPTTSEVLTLIYMKIEQDLTSTRTNSTQRLQKIIKDFENTLVHYTVLSVKNQELMKQNNEKTLRTSIRSTIVGGPKVMTYDDIVERQRLRETTERRNSGVTKRRTSNYKSTRTTSQNR